MPKSIKIKFFKMPREKCLINLIAITITTFIEIKCNHELTRIYLIKLTNRFKKYLVNASTA